MCVCISLEGRQAHSRSLRSPSSDLRWIHTMAYIYIYIYIRKRGGGRGSYTAPGTHAHIQVKMAKLHPPLELLWLTYRENEKKEGLSPPCGRPSLIPQTCSSSSSTFIQREGERGVQCLCVYGIILQDQCISLSLSLSLAVRFKEHLILMCNRVPGVMRTLLLLAIVAAAAAV